MLKCSRSEHSPCKLSASHHVAPYSCYAFEKAYLPGRHAFISMLTSCPVLQSQLQAELLSLVEQFTFSVMVSKSVVFT